MGLEVGLFQHAGEAVDEIDDEVNGGRVHVRALDDTAAAQFDEAGNVGRGGHHEAIGLDADVEPVIGDKAGIEPAVLPAIEKFERQQRLTGAAGTAQHDAVLAEDQAGGVDVLEFGGRHYLRARGRVTVKRAPERSVRLVASMRPLWATTICLEIERPRPE